MNNIITQKNLYRFWDKVLFTTDCWEWQRGLDKDGYGQLTINTKKIKPHRFSYELYKGKIPEGLEIDHLCRNRKCVNPNHLELVTHQENIKRGDKTNLGLYNKVKTHCKRGHEFNKENSYFYKTQRMCKICLTIRTKIYRK